MCIRLLKQCQIDDFFSKYNMVISIYLPLAVQERIIHVIPGECDILS